MNYKVYVYYRVNANPLSTTVRSFNLDAIHEAQAYDEAKALIVQDKELTLLNWYVEPEVKG